ncbi:MAG: TRAP transporter permease [Pseudomonadota bacterium]|jgi:TRAP transporter 4TM/12TM fusion protein|nr:TRAP transporter permease [Pseudomonadota bacterium]
MPTQRDDSQPPVAGEIEYRGRNFGQRLQQLIAVVAISWTLFQLWIASPLPFLIGWGVLIDVPKRGIHLAFALLLCFLLYPATARGRKNPRMPWYDVVLALGAAGCALYLPLAYDGLVDRQGVLLEIQVGSFSVPLEFLIGALGIALLMEATRRAIGLPLVIVGSVFLVYSVFGQSMPDLISHKGVSVERLVGYHWLGGEAIFGIPIDISVSFVFLFVLFGALLEKAGAGRYFLDLAFALVGRYRGGPAKAAILASGMTGSISGSSIANVVTTGTFTIPIMKRMGMPATKAGAIEVAASTNGQIMPPIMGAAAFIIAEFIGIAYFEVVTAAVIPALISYIALFYISHLEAVKLGLKGLPRTDIPRLLTTFLRGLHYLVPIGLLVYLLLVKRWSPGSAVFYSILLLMVIILCQHVVRGWTDATMTLKRCLIMGVNDILLGMASGARNMVTIGVAVASAGIIVGAVSSTGLNNAMIGVIETLAGNNVYLLLGLTAVLCLLLGIGLPTTANYLVVASLLAGVVVELGNAAGLMLPLIGVHLFVFYFGLLADDTPPVCLAAFAASAISRADPLRTGCQAFAYDIRTAILPFVFIFNPELLLIGVESWWHGLVVFVVSLLAILCFSSATQGWMLVRNRWYENVLLLLVTLALFRPDALMNLVFPEFEQARLDHFVAGKLETVPGQKMRLHVTRETDYGDRYKLFVFETAPVRSTLKDSYGLDLSQGRDGRWSVDNLAYMGIAEKTGLEFGDFLTAVDIEQPTRPARQWIYLPAGLLLVLTVLAQFRRRRGSTAAQST